MIQNKIEVAKDVYLIGKIDDRDVPFHRLVLTKGTTYNSYFIDSELPTVIDTVDMSFGREYVEELKKHLDPATIKYIVINHVEPDHSGSLPALASQAKNAVIVCTELAADELKKMYRLYDRDFLIVTDGDTLDIGGKTLKFYETPYLHTEETMITFCEEDKILFSCDIFSTHIANTEYFNDAVKDNIKEDYILYYQLIMHPHRRHIKEMLGKICKLEIQMIAPAHGFILRKNVQEYIDLYEEMSRESEVERKATIIYSSMTGNTKKLSKQLKANLELDSIQVDLLDLNNTDENIIIRSVQESDLLLIGASTKYADMTGKTEEIIKKIVELDLQGKVCGAFGSYGWSGEGIEVLQDYLLKSNMNILTTSEIIKTTGVNDVQFPLRIRFHPEDETARVIERTTNYISGILLNAS